MPRQKTLLLLRTVMIISVVALVAAQCATPPPEQPLPEAVATATPPTTEEVPTVTAGFEAAGLDNLPDLSGQTLHLLTWEGYAPDELVKSFQDATGATVEVTYISDNNELIDKLRDVSKGWDIAQPTLNMIPLAQEQYSLYQPIDTARIANMDRLIASIADRVAQYTAAQDGQYAVPFTWGTTGLIVNTAKVKEPITSYTQMCDPAYAGHVTYRYRYATFLGMAYGLGYDPFAAADNPEEWRKIMEDTLDYMVACDANVKAYWKTRQENIDLMLREEAYIAEGWDGTGWLVSRVKPEIKYVAPETGAVGWLDTFAIPTGADNLDAAYAWINFMYEPKNAGKLSQDSGYVSAVEDSLDYIPEELAALVKESMTPEAVEKIKWPPPLTPELEEINAEVTEKLRLLAENRPKHADLTAIETIFGVEGLDELPNLSGQTLRILTWEGYVPEDLKNAFEQATGAKVDITYVSDNDELVEKLRESGAPGWDLAQPTSTEVLPAQELYRLYQPIDYERLTGLENVNQLLKSRVSAYSTIQGQTYAIPFTWGTTGLIVNTAKTGGAVDSYRQLCDPSYAGHVTYRQSYATIVAMSYGLGNDLYAAVDNPEEWQKIMEETVDYMVGCDPNVRAYWTTRQENIDLMLREEAYVAEGWDGTGWLVSRQNPSIKFIAPKEGALGFIDASAIPANANNVNAAYAWINFMSKPKNAGKLIVSSGYLSAVDGAVDYLPENQTAMIEESYTQEAFENILWSPVLTGEIKKINLEMTEKLREGLKK